MSIESLQVQHAIIYNRMQDTDNKEEYQALKETFGAIGERVQQIESDHEMALKLAREYDDMQVIAKELQYKLKPSFDYSRTDDSDVLLQDGKYRSLKAVRAELKGRRDALKSVKERFKALGYYRFDTQNIPTHDANGSVLGDRSVQFQMAELFEDQRKRCYNFLSKRPLYLTMLEDRIRLLS